MSDTKRPSMNWYPGDHQRDTGIKACAFEPRGLWREMMDLMHDGEPYGHLTAGGVPILPPDLSRIIGIPLSQLTKYLKELEDRKVFSRAANGVIFSRRMVRDEEARRTKKRNGKLGGNPKLVNHEDNWQDIHPLYHEVNQHVGSVDNLSPASDAVAVAFASALQPPPPRDGAQSSRGSTAQAMVSVVPAEFRPDMQTLLDLVPNVTAWTAEMRVAIEGMHGKPITALQLGQAVRDYLASGKAKLSPSLRSFRRYMQGMLEEDLPKTNGHLRPKSLTGLAQSVCQNLRQHRNPMFPNSVPPVWKESVPDGAIEAVRPFLSRIFADDPKGEGTLVAQLARALEEATV